MSDSQESINVIGVINLREFVSDLFQHKWILCGVPLAFAVIVFVVNVIILPPVYEASAYVTFTDPMMTAEFESSIILSPVFPDSQAFVFLAEADAILDEVRKKLLLDDEEFRQLEFDAELRGARQLWVQVKAANPIFSAKIANTWADVLVKRLNDLDGTGEKRVSLLEAEVERTRGKWNAAQVTLEKYLTESNVEVLEVQFSGTKETLSNYLDKIEHNKILISDAKVLNEQLSDLNPENALSIGQILSIIALQQRSSGEISGTQFQILDDEILGEGFSITSGRKNISNLINALEEQNVELIENVSNLEDRIVYLFVELESEKFEVEKLIQERDLAQSAYSALSNQFEETRITQSQGENFAKIGAEAIVPIKRSDRNKYLYVTLAAVVGLLFSISGIFFYEWWQAEE
jgi:uncharacterized protein involved in exopolysaccharide biosynthesis